MTPLSVSLTPEWFLETVLTHPDGVPLGDRVDPWQRDDFAAFLDTRKNLWLDRPRAHAKTFDSSVMAMTDLMTGRPGQRIYFAATDQDQAALALDTMRGFIRRVPTLHKLLRVLQHEIVYTNADSVVRVLPADAPGSWGLRPSLMICDELSQWRTEAHEEFFWSLWSSLGKVPGRMIVATTAGWNRASLCWKVREKIADDPSWRMAVRGQCASWISPEFLEAQRRLLPAHLYEMLHENRWTQAGAEYLTWEEIDGVFDQALAEWREPVAARYWMGLDIGVAKDRTAIAVVRQDGRGAVVDALAMWEGTPRERVSLGEVEEAAVELARRFRPEALILDPTEGLLLAERLRNRGVPVEEYRFTMPSRAALMDTLLQMIRQARLRSFPHPAFRDELSGLRWTAKAGVLRPDHSASGHDDAVMAVGLAAQAAVREGSAEMGDVSKMVRIGGSTSTGSPFGPYGERRYPGRRDSTEFDEPPY